MRFGGLIAINDVSFQARRGQITALIGPNGAGKTTVFNCVTGFYKPTEGMITLRQKGGREFLLERMPDFKIAAKAKVARTFQNIRLFGGMTVLENLLVAQHNTLMIASGMSVLGLLGFPSFRRAEDEAIEKARLWLEEIHLLDRADDLGLALQLTNILRDVREDAVDMNRVYLPQEDLARFDIPESALFRGEIAAGWNEFVANHVERARGYFATGYEVLQYIPRRPAACVHTMAGIYEELLKKIERDPGLPLRERAALSKTEKLRVVVRSWLSSSG